MSKTVNFEKSMARLEEIVELLENNDLRQKMINEWIEFSKKFSWENTAKNFLQLINKLWN